MNREEMEYIVKQAKQVTAGIILLIFFVVLICLIHGD